jgi:hypothetical protein
MRAETVNSQNGQGEQYPLAQVGDPENIEELLKHVGLSASGHLPP